MNNSIPIKLFLSVNHRASGNIFKHIRVFADLKIVRLQFSFNSEISSKRTLLETIVISGCPSVFSFIIRTRPTNYKLG